MSFRIESTRTESALALNILVNGSGGGITGLSGTVSVRDGVTTDSFLDFADLTFKTSGWTTQFAALTEVGLGSYALAGGLNVGGITNLPAATETLVTQFAMSGGVAAAAIDIIQLVDSDVGADTELLVKFCRNRRKFDPGTQKMTLYDDDGTTPLQQWTLLTDLGESVVSPIGVQSEQSAPEL